MPKHQYFRSEIARGIENGSSGVIRDFKHDKGKGAIFGYAVISKGVLKNDIRDWEMDDISLEQIMELGNQSKIGIKSRFGHPNISSDALGTFLGRAKNFRREGDIVRADLYFDETAYKTPNGDLAGYVMDLAQTDPDAFGSSIVFDAKLEYRLEADGTRKKDAEGKEFPALVRFTKLFASDVVDDPAANEGMFNRLFVGTNVELSAKGTEFLDKFLNNPDAVERVINFLQRYQSNRVEAIDKENINPDNLKKEGNVEIKEITLEMLEKERPDLCKELSSKGTQDAIKGERTRALDIVKATHKEFAGMGMETLCEEAIEKGNTLDAALSSMRGKRLEDLKVKANPAPGADEDLTKTAKTHLEKATEYAKEHKCTMTEALRATAEKKVKTEKK